MLSKTAMVTSNFAVFKHSERTLRCGITTFFFIQHVMAYNATSGRLTEKLDSEYQSLHK